MSVIRVRITGGTCNRRRRTGLRSQESLRKDGGKDDRIGDLKIVFSGESTDLERETSDDPVGIRHPTYTFFILT